MRKTTKRRKKVQEMLYSTFRGNEATRYGMEMEEATKQEYTAYQQQNGNPLTVHNCGPFVSLENPWLAAGPDGMVYDPSDTSQPEGLIEIKNPFSARHKTLNEACDSSTFCLKQLNRGGQTTYTLKRQHDHYYQIQCQMYCVHRHWCDFVLRTDKDLHIERIYRDQAWWEGQLPKLSTFYFDALLPELAFPRQGQGESGNQPMKNYEHSLVNTRPLCVCIIINLPHINTAFSVYHSSVVSALAILS